MRILAMLPAAQGVYPAEAEERRLALMRSYATAATQVDVDYMPEVSGLMPWLGNESKTEPELDRQASSLADEYSARRAVQAEAEGYDAFCPFGLLDIGVKRARELTSRIFVIGQSEACLLACELLGRRFASCSYVPGGDRRWFAVADEAGLGDRLVAHTAIGIPNSEYPERRAEVLEEFRRCAAEARAKGAEIMGLIAMSICPVEFSAQELAEAGGLPVLDGLGTQIALAEWWHRVGLAPSLLRYPR